MASPSTGHCEAAAGAVLQRTKEKRAAWYLRGKPTALPMPRASQHWPGMQLLAPGGWVSLQLRPWVVSCIPLGVERAVLQHTPSLRHHGDGEEGHEIGQGKPMSQGEMGTKGETAGGEGSP